MEKSIYGKTLSKTKTPKKYKDNILNKSAAQIWDTDRLDMGISSRYGNQTPLQLLSSVSGGFYRVDMTLSGRYWLDITFSVALFRLFDPFPLGI